MSSLLVTNDFPPKVGGIQSYLWELWRRLPPDQVTVYTTPYREAAAFDAAQPIAVRRHGAPVLLPTPGVRRAVDGLIGRLRSDVVFLDPALPLGAIGPRLRSALPYVVVLHGAETTIPARLPGSAALLRSVIDRAAGIVAAGAYPAREAVRLLDRPIPALIIPPGVDTQRFHSLTSDESLIVRARFGLPAMGMGQVVLGVSRLVPRKGFDVLIDAVARLDRHVHLAIAGSGRDLPRLRRRVDAAGLGDRMHFLGRVSDDDLPALYGCADVFAMLCRDRWRGLEQEGFGIVFLEAAAAGIPSIAGRSGGSADAVIDGETGRVVDPTNARHVSETLHALLADRSVREAMGRAARERAVAEFDYDVLAARLEPLARGDLSVLQPFDERPHR